MLEGIITIFILYLVLALCCMIKAIRMSKKEKKDG